MAARIDAALAVFDFRAATDAIWTVVAAANRYVESERPWELAGRGDDRLDAVLSTLVATCRTLAHELAPFLPEGTERLNSQLGAGPTLAPPQPVFPRTYSGAPSS